MKAYLSAAKQIIGRFGTVKVAHVGQAQNRHANSLATLASSAIKDTSRLVKIKLIREPSIDVKNDYDPARVEVAMVSMANPCWMNPIIDFLAEDKVPDNEKEAKRFIGWLLDTGRRQIVNCTGGLLQALTFYAYIPSCMMECVVAMLGGGL